MAHEKEPLPISSDICTIQLIHVNAIPTITAKKEKQNESKAKQEIEWEKCRLVLSKEMKVDHCWKWWKSSLAEKLAIAHGCLCLALFSMPCVYMSFTSFLRPNPIKKQQFECEIEMEWKSKTAEHWKKVKQRSTIWMGFLKWMKKKIHSTNMSRHNTELPFVSMHAFRNVDSKLQMGKKIDGVSYDIHTLYRK